jgi:hypothetical protein
VGRSSVFLLFILVGVMMLVLRIAFDQVVCLWRVPSSLFDHR